MEKSAYVEMYLNEDRHWWFAARRIIIGKILSGFLGGGNKRKILEIGCGTGGNLKFLSAYGDLHAIEVDEGALAMASKRGICHVKKGLLPDDIPFDSCFDLICMLDVLEHIDDDLSALESVLKILNPCGKILITVPAYKFLWSEHDVTLHHKRRYEKKELIELVQKSGFNIKYCTYINTLLFPAIAVIRFLKKIHSKKRGTDVSMPGKTINSLLTAIFSAERFFVPRITLPFGTSILILAEK